MHKHALFAALAAAALVPSLASAQTSCEQRKHDNRVVGTVLGAGIGAVLGSQVAGHGARTEGSVIGGVGGAVIGNQIGKSATDCSGYGYYDSSGVWHANVQGYYDRDGHWVEARSGGYYDRYGTWHSRGPGHFDADGYWVADAAPAYGYGADVAYTDRDPWYGAPRGVRAREDWLYQRIRDGRRDGSLTRDEADQARHDLDDIRRKEAGFREGDGVLSPRDRYELNQRLDRLALNIRDMRLNHRRDY
ncbi:MAG TPA: glycine zipper 2TM domain-containing protein [Caulobacteraceae bacterium]|nr:glycine zipper 2TM domain-containing protein [Caulobacteraceae bacterium]